MKFHYLSWRTSNSSFLLQFLGKQLNVRVCPRKIKRIDRIVATVQRRRSNGASYSSVSSRYFRRVESIYCFHRHRPSRCASRTGFKGNRIRGVRKLLPKRLSLFTGNALTSSRKTALLSRHHFSRESYVVRGRLRPLIAARDRVQTGCRDRNGNSVIYCRWRGCSLA